MPPGIAEHPTWAEIDAEALQKNVAWIKGRISPATRLLAVVKADAYGHGAVGVSRVLSAVGVDYFGVAHVREGEILREAGIREPILILSETISELLPRVVQGNFTQTVYTTRFIELLNDAAARMGRRISVHLKIDTGMGRVGASVHEVGDVFQMISKSPHLVLAGLYTHFASADEGEGEKTKRQFALFRGILREGPSAAGMIRHAANSSALLHFPEMELDMVRVGILLYGIAPHGESLAGLSPVLSLKTEVRYIKEVPVGTPLSYGGTFVTRRESRIATIPVGYADGLPVRVSNRAFVLIGGKRFPLVGRVTMDMSLVDITEGTVVVGDEVIIIGTQQGERISAEEMSKWAETIPYETVCGIGKRIPRIVVGENVFIPKVAAAKL